MATNPALAMECQYCGDDEAEQYCPNCPDGSQYYCSDCADYHKRRKANAAHDIRAIEDTSSEEQIPFINFLKFLGFADRLVKNKLTHNDALVIRNTDYNATDTFQPTELLALILQKAMACNHHCRQVFLRKQTTEEPFPIVYHPMDTLLALILCCDSIFLQDLYRRLYACQLAIPLLLPNPVTKKITFPLWAMRDIVSHWKYHDEKANEYVPCEDRLVECPFPLISFMRLSKAKGLYKSKLLNGVISDSKHPYFFDSDCPGSDTKRRYVDGLVEVCWYLPSGNKSDLYRSPVTFCNLRGDSKNHFIQFKILMKISTVCFLFLNITDINDTLMKQLCFESESRTSHVCFLMNFCTPDMKEFIEKQVTNCSVLALKHDGFAAAVEKIQSKINQSLPGITHALSDHLNFSSDEFEIDENLDTSIIQGKKCANEVMEKFEISSEQNSMMIKQQLLPLQGLKYWQEWAKLNKKEKRKQLSDMGNMNESEFRSLMNKQKNTVVQKMLQIKTSKAMKTFIEVLSTAGSQAATTTFFLHWLRLQLDDLSRKVLPKLRQKCNETRALLKKVENDKAEQSKDKKTQLIKQLRQESQELTHASFGIEHFFRELGVMYEIASNNQSADPQLWSQVKNFPKIIAQLLLSGYPFELLDGDAAHIAINWIKAILDKLKKQIRKNSRLFVLSVLGIQSSGKSTLLNTAFGLRFAVSAGRCTKGAYFQLLKCDNCDTSLKANCDYILVIDTEGLRASELEYKGTQKHDNELATLVIGLASVTIVNVFGEVSGEMDDILQTSVHAFLRMRRANLRPSCLLVKHHVDEVTANKGMEGLYKLQKKLDEMALYAAREEHAEGLYKEFSDVIQFNVEQDVRYFPSLWTGAPPMSPVNPKYSETAQKLKMRVIDSISARPDPCKAKNCENNILCTLQEFKSRVDTLWDAVLRENFIFNFKNTLEIAAFNELDQLSGKWSWDLEDLVQTWELETCRHVKGGKIESDSDCKEQVKKIEKKLDELHENIKNEIKNLFERHESALILAQWRPATEMKFTKLVEGHKVNAWKFCKHNRDKEKLSQKVKDETGYREKIQQEVKELVESMEIDKDTKITEQKERELNDIFSCKWETWMKDMERNVPMPPSYTANISDQILQQLSHCGIDHLMALIRDTAHKHPLSSIAEYDDHHFHIDRDKHVNKVGGVLTNVKAWFWSSKVEETFCLITQRTADMMRRRKKYLDDICEEQEEYQIRHVQIIVHELIQKDIDELEKQVCDTFTFTTEFRVDAILFICRHALRVFEILQKKSYDNHPITYFKSLEQMYRNKFILLCTKGVEEKATAMQTAVNAANNLALLVMKSVQSEFPVQMIQALEENERHNIVFQSLRALKRAVLLRLLDKNNFDEFKLHLTDVSQSYLKWIVRIVDEDCCKIITTGESIIVTIAKEQLQIMQHDVENAAQESFKLSRKANIEQWLEGFHKQLSLPIKKEDLVEFVGDETVELQLFKETFIRKIYDDMKALTNELCNDSNSATFSDCKREVVRKLHSKCVACSAQCPFCKEQCEYSQDHSGYHACLVHRSQCLGGYRDSETGEMSLLVCNDGVRENGKFFRSKITNKKFVPYKDYRKYYSDWFIDDHGDTPRYWQWFVAQYAEDIAAFWKMKEPISQTEQSAVIFSWKKLSVSDAKKDVEDQFKKYE